MEHTAGDESRKAEAPQEATSDMALGSSATAAAAENAVQSRDGAAQPAGGKVGHSCNNITMQCLKHKAHHDKIRAVTIHRRDAVSLMRRGRGGGNLYMDLLPLCLQVLVSPIAMS